MNGLKDRRVRMMIFSIPVTVIYAALFFLPMAMLAVESALTFEPGFVGSRPDAAWTFANYRALSSGAFVATMLTTFRISLIASLVGVALAFPLSYLQVRVLPQSMAKLLLSFLVVLMFLGVLVRTYALQLVLGSVGPLNPLLSWLGVAQNGRPYIEFSVGVGLLHYIVPLSALTLIPAVQAVSPRLIESALSLGASRVVTHATVTFPLCAKGLLAAFTLSMTFSLSAFVIPMILGRGRVNFVSGLVYTRFSEIANYPGGGAIAIAMLVLSLGFVIGFSSLARHWTRARG